MATGGVRAGAAFIELYVKDGLDKGLRQARAKLQSFANTMRNIGLGLTGIGAAVLGPVAGFATIFANVGDEVQKTAIRTGMLAESVSALRYAAGQSGTSLKALENGVRRMQRTVADGMDGDATALEGLGRFGLKPEDLANLAPEDQLRLFADRMAAIKNPTQRAAAMMEVFGRSGAELIPLMQGGSQGIDQLMQKAADLGLILDQEAADSAAALTDALDDMWQASKGVAVQIGGAVAPVITTVSKAIAQAAAVVGEFAKNNKELILIVVGTFAAITALGIGFLGVALVLNIITGAITGLITIMGLLTAAVAFIATPIGAAIVLIGALIAVIAAWGIAIGYATGFWSWAAEKIGQAFAYLWETLMPVFDGLIKAMMSGKWQTAASILWQGIRIVFSEMMAAITNEVMQWRDEITGILKDLASVNSYLFGPVVGGFMEDVYGKGVDGAFKMLGKVSKQHEANAKKARAELAGLLKQVEDAEASTSTRSPIIVDDFYREDLPSLEGIGDQVAKAWELAVGTSNSFAVDRIGTQAAPLERVENQLQEMNSKLGTLVEQGEDAGDEFAE